MNAATDTLAQPPETLVSEPTAASQQTAVPVAAPAEPAAALQGEQVDAEFLLDLETWPLQLSTLKAELEFLEGYTQKHPFARDQRRIQTLRHYIARLESQA